MASKLIATTTAILILGGGLGACQNTSGSQTAPDAAIAEHTLNKFAPRPTDFRIALVDKNNLNPAQAEMLAARPDYNIYKMLAHHTVLYNRWSPLGRMLLNGSSISARDREIAMLRMGWLCQSEYEFAQHARIAHDSVGMTREEIARISKGAGAQGWTSTERAVLRMVDELRYNAVVSDETWAALRADYDENQTIELILTALQYQLVSMALNSLGVQLDPGLDIGLPDETHPPLATAVASGKLNQPRLPILLADDFSSEQIALLPPAYRDNLSPPNLDATLLRHPDLYQVFNGFIGYLDKGTSLPSQMRELLILRTAYLHNSANDWAHHVSTARLVGLSDEKIAAVVTGPEWSGWSEAERTALQAVDDLRREAFITDAVFSRLQTYLDNEAIIELVYTVGGHAMLGALLNTLGIETESGLPNFGKVD